MHAAKTCYEVATRKLSQYSNLKKSNLHDLQRCCEHEDSSGS